MLWRCWGAETSSFSLCVSWDTAPRMHLQLCRSDPLLLVTLGELVLSLLGAALSFIQVCDGDNEWQCSHLGGNSEALLGLSVALLSKTSPKEEIQ